MSRRPFLVLVLLLSLAASADVRLGDEVAISPVGAPQFSRGSRPRVASNGREFLALWRDEESVTYALAFDANGAAKAQYATRVGTSIRSLEIASDGNEYLVVWSDSVTLYSQRLDADGKTIEAPRTIAVRPSPKASISMHVASNGTGYVVAAEGTGSQLLDARGEKVATLPFTNVVWIGSRGSEFHVIERRDVCAATCATRFELTPVSGSGVLGTTITLADTEGRGFLAVAAASNSELLVADAKNVRVFSRDGALRAQQAFPFPFTPARMYAAWDGKQFVVIVSGNDGVYFMRVTPQGAIMEAKAFPRRPDLFDESVRMASNGSRELVLWRESGVVGRSVFAFEELDASAPEKISIAPEAKIGPQIAVHGGNEIIAWIDQRTATIEGRANGVAFSLTPLEPMEGKFSVAAGDDGFVLAWYERGAVWGKKLIATRIARDGSILGRVIVRQLWQSDAGRPAVAFGNGEFLFAINDRGEFRGSMHFVGLTANGTIRPLRTIEPDGIDTDILSPRVVWNGTEFVAAYVAYDQKTARLDFVRVAGGDPMPVLEFTSEGPGAFGFAHGAGRMTAVVPHGGLAVVQEKTASSLASFRPSNVEMVWNGAEYVVAWTDSDAEGFHVRALRLDATAKPLDAAPIEIGPADASRSPSLTLIADGVKIAYDRVDLANHDAVRVFARTLERIRSAATTRARAAAR